MLPAEYIASLPTERQQVVADIHHIIVAQDKTVIAVVEPMMGKEMIVYKGKGLMKYGLASVKNYMTLHLMPMYASPKIYALYKSLLGRANFQKGCINFVSGDDMPLAIVKRLIIDCAAVDLLKLKNDYLQAKNIRKKTTH